MDASTRLRSSYGPVLRLGHARECPLQGLLFTGWCELASCCRVKRVQNPSQHGIMPQPAASPGELVQAPGSGRRISQQFACPRYLQGRSSLLTCEQLLLATCEPKKKHSYGLSKALSLGTRPWPETAASGDTSPNTTPFSPSLQTLEPCSAVNSGREPCDERFSGFGFGFMAWLVFASGLGLESHQRLSSISEKDAKHDKYD